MNGQKAIITKTALYEIEEPSMNELCDTLIDLINYVKENGSSPCLKNPFWKIVMRLANEMEFTAKKEPELKAGSKNEIRKKISKD